MGVPHALVAVSKLLSDGSQILCWWEPEYSVRGGGRSPLKGSAMLWEAGANCSAECSGEVGAKCSLQGNGLLWQGEPNALLEGSQNAVAK